MSGIPTAHAGRLHGAHSDAIKGLHPLKIRWQAYASPAEKSWKAAALANFPRELERIGKHLLVAELRLRGIDCRCGRQDSVLLRFTIGKFR